MADMVETFEYVARATSTSSHTFAVGSKVFAMVGGYGLYTGAAVRISKSSTEWLDGIVTAVDLAAQTVTVNVTGVTGSGSNASWTIGLGSAATNMASSPATIAEGGTGGTTVETARLNLNIGQEFTVDAILSTPPGGIDGHYWLVGEAPTSTWTGQENKLALFTTGTGYTFVTPAVGAQVFNSSLTEKYVYTGVVEAFEGLWATSKWKELTPGMAKWGFDSGSNNITVLAQDHGTWFTLTPGSGGKTVTLPIDASSAGMRIVIEKIAASAGNLTIQISGGSNIRLADGTAAASIVVLAANYSRLHMVAGKSGVTGNLWYVE